MGPSHPRPVRRGPPPRRPTPIDVLDLGDQFRQRRREPATQPAQLGRERGQPAVAVRRVAGRPGRDRPVPRPDCLIRRRWPRTRPAGGDSAAQRSAGGRGRSPAGQPASAPGQRGQVARTDPPAGAGQQPGQRRPGSVVGQHAQRRHDVATSGVVSSPPRPTTSTGSPAASSASASSGICERRRTSTAAVRSPAGRVRHSSRSRSGSQARLVLDGLACSADATRPGLRRRAGRAARLPPRRGRSGAATALAASQDPLGRCGSWWPAGTPVAGVAVGVRERRREPADVARARAPPAVDRLERIADRRDRMAAAEQAAQHLDLSVTGVLVLVEQHRRVPRTLATATSGSSASRAANAIWSPKSTAAQLTLGARRTRAPAGAAPGDAR